MARDESRYVDRRRAATGLARALARAPSAVAWCGRAQRSCWADGAGAAGLGPITALGMGARDEHARQRSGACASAPRGQAEGSADGYLLHEPCDGVRHKKLEKKRNKRKVEAF